MTTGTRERVRPARRPDASMSLLTDLFANPIDEGYRAAAGRRAADGSRASRGRSWWLLPGLLVVALVLTMSAVQARRSAGVFSAERESLVSRIEERDAYAAGLERRVEQLQAELSDLESARLATTEEGEQLRSTLEQLQATTGTGPVVGPGVVVTLTDAPEEPSAAGSGEEVDFGRVLDVDVQRVVNGLWAAGAEAVSVNGQRVTVLTAIRSANDVVLVNYRPLRPPYEIAAIGDPRTLGSRFTEGPGGQWLRAIHTAHGIDFEVRTDEELTLPGNGAATLRYATAGGAP